MLRYSVIAVVCLLALPAAAQPITGLYFGGSVGVGFPEKMTSPGGTETRTLKPGPFGLGAVGWGFGNGLRVELEGSDRSNKVSGISTLRVNGQLMPLSNTHGTLSTPAVMANLDYDIPVQQWHIPFQPYVGAGIGYTKLDFGGAGGNEPVAYFLPNGNVYAAPSSLTTGSASAVAYQVIAGSSLPIRSVPGLDVTLEYRYFASARANEPETLTCRCVVNGVTPSGTRLRGFEAQDNALLIGLRYTFGQLH